MFEPPKIGQECLHFRAVANFPQQFGRAHDQVEDQTARFEEDSEGNRRDLVSLLSQVYWQFPGRESEDYFCAFPDCTLSPDRSVLGFDQGPGNGQPQPGAPAFAVPGFIHPVEALKDLRQMILGYTRTAVNNRA